MIYILNDKYTAEIKQLKKSDYRELMEYINQNLIYKINNVEGLIGNIKNDSQLLTTLAYLKGIMDYFNAKGHKIKRLGDLTNANNTLDKHLIE